MAGFQLSGMGGTDGFSLGSGGNTSGFDTGHLTMDAGESIYSLGSGAYQYQGYGQDYAEAAKLGQFYPSTKTTSTGGTEPAPWWEGLARYGVTRAVDAAFMTRNAQNNQSATYAGQNGQTYQQGRAPSPVMGGNNLLLLLLIGAGFMIATD